MDNKDERQEREEFPENRNDSFESVTDILNDLSKMTETPTEIKPETMSQESPTSIISQTAQISPISTKKEAKAKRVKNDEPNEEDLHDIEFDSETEKPITDRALRRAKEARKQLRKQRQARKTVFQIICGIVLSAVVIFFGVRLGFGLYDAIADYGGLEDSEFEVAVEIPDNPTVEQVANALKESGIVREPEVFKLYLKLQELKGESETFVGGNFFLSSSMNYSSIVDALSATGSKRTTVDVTIIEGMTAIEIGKLLEENYVCRAEDFEKFYREKMNVYDFERRVEPEALKFNQLEGYLFPDRYQFYECNALKQDPNTDTTEQAEVAASRIYSNFNSKITKTMYKQMHEMGLTLDQLITLASMVQSEVSDVDDMRKVASVFLNRLAAGGDFSKLQSDVTVFYVQDFIEPYYDDYGLSPSLAAISNAYDTYECDGVPVGPICNPGMDAIGAVLDAEETNYYYFCANEETGETYYATTLEEHEQNLVLAGLV